MEPEQSPADGRSPPDVSFIVAAYNVAPYVETAIASALEQRDVTVEVIVVDDCSSDRTADIVAALADKDPRILLVRRSERGGPSIARNAAIDLARGAWLAILDADDYVAPERSRRLIDLATATSADVVADNFDRFSDYPPAKPSYLAAEREPFAFFVDIASLLRGNAMFDKDARLGYLKAIFRADFMRTHNIRHPEEIFIGEDYHLLMSCLLAGARFVVTSERLYAYRVREGSISWRLSGRDIDRLLRAHRESGIENRAQFDDEIKTAAAIYVRALEKANVLVEVIDHAKAGNWPKAIAITAHHPEVWLLLARFGGAALRKRLTLRP